MEQASIPTPQIDPRQAQVLIFLATAAACVYLYRRYLDASLRRQEAFQAQLQVIYERGLAGQPLFAGQPTPTPRPERVATVVPITTANGHQERRFTAPPAEPEPAGLADLPQERKPDYETGGQVEDFELEERPGQEEIDFDQTRPIAPDTPGPVGDGGEAA